MNLNLKLTTVLLWLLVATLPACNDDDNDDTAPATTTRQVRATLSGQQEVPATTSAATGSLTGTYDTATRELTYTVTYQSLVPSAGHIHQAAPGVNGPVIVPFANVTTSPITGSTTLSEANAAKLLSGETYVNLHTPVFPGGEIRGNIMVQ